jgi:hypothetical protein
MDIAIEEAGSAAAPSNIMCSLVGGLCTQTPPGAQGFLMLSRVVRAARMVVTELLPSASFARPSKSYRAKYGPIP